jgi:hypothetical protein
MDNAPVTRGIRWKLLTTMVGLIVVLVAFLSADRIVSEAEILERELDRRVALQRALLVARGRALADTITRQAENDIAAFNFFFFGPTALLQPPVLLVSVLGLIQVVAARRHFLHFITSKN